MTALTQSEQKQLAAQKALTYIRSNMVVGLGSGSTAEKFIALLGEAVTDNQIEHIKVVSSSQKSAQIAKSLGLKVLDPESVDTLDINVDGTDETDIHNGASVKGGGNALHREKMIALKSQRNIFIAEAKKAVTHLGAFGLPIEIGQFDANATLKRIADLLEPGAKVDFKTSAGQRIITDNHNFMVHINFGGSSLAEPNSLYSKLKSIEGVFSVGLFLGIANQLIIGRADGSTQEFNF